MQTITIKLSDVKAYPTNPNTHNDHQIGELAKSLDQFEQVKNIVVWQGHVIAGHGLRQAAMASGITELEAVDVSDWPREKAEKFMITDNRLPELAEIDPEAMALVLVGFDEPLNIPGVDEEWLAGFGFGGGENYSDFDSQLEEMEGFEEVNIQITVIAKHKSQIEEWLANGELKTSPGFGKGVMKRCGLL